MTDEVAVADGLQLRLAVVLDLMPDPRAVAADVGHHAHVGLEVGQIAALEPPRAVGNLRVGLQRELVATPAGDLAEELRALPSLKLERADGVALGVLDDVGFDLVEVQEGADIFSGTRIAAWCAC